MRLVPVDTYILAEAFPSPHNGLTLEKMLNKPISEWGGKRCAYTVLNMSVKAMICVWIEPEEIGGQEEFRDFLIDGKHYFFETSYSVFTEEEN